MSHICDRCQEDDHRGGGCCDCDHCQPWPWEETAEKPTAVPPATPCCGDVTTLNGARKE